jgi:hypothetical protein
LTERWRIKTEPLHLRTPASSSPFALHVTVARLFTPAEVVLALTKADFCNAQLMAKAVRVASRRRGTRHRTSRLDWQQRAAQSVRSR